MELQKNPANENDPEQKSQQSPKQRKVSKHLIATGLLVVLLGVAALLAYNTFQRPKTETQRAGYSHTSTPVPSPTPLAISGYRAVYFLATLNAGDVPTVKSVACY